MSILNVNKWGEIKRFANFPGSKKFPGATSAQIASSNQVLTSMGWGVQTGEVGGLGGGGLVSGLTGKRPPCSLENMAQCATQPPPPPHYRRALAGGTDPPALLFGVEDYNPTLKIGAGFLTCPQRSRSDNKGGRRRTLCRKYK